jgi:hypothetical protein
MTVPAASVGLAPARGRPAWGADWRAVVAPLRWLATAAGMTAGVVRQALRPVAWRRPA